MTSEAGPAMSTENADLKWPTRKLVMKDSPLHNDLFHDDQLLGKYTGIRFSYIFKSLSRKTQKIILSRISSFSKKSRAVSKATCAASSFGYPYTPVEMQGKAYFNQINLFKDFFYHVVNFLLWIWSHLHLPISSTLYSRKPSAHYCNPLAQRYG